MARGIPPSMPRYGLILDGKMPPAYMLCASLPAGVRKAELANMEEERLWECHGPPAERLRERREMLLEKPGMDVPWTTGPGEASLLDLKAELARRVLRSCRLCERRCGVDRTAGEKGVCGVGGVDATRVSSIFVHLGEEPELVPSLTVFFSGCTLECDFCQNHDISRSPGAGRVYTPGSLAGKLAEFSGRGMGVLNVNWVGGDPTPAIPLILEVLTRLDEPLPQVFNSNMYLTQESMELLDGVVDVFLADFKFGTDECAKRLCRVDRYVEVVGQNHAGAARTADLMVRHLMLPGHLECCTVPVITWLEENVGPHAVRLNVMDQYRPEYRARRHPELDGHVSSADFDSAVRLAEMKGFRRPY